MKIGKTKFIPENIAPENALSLAIFNGNTKICSVDISKMKPEFGEKLYSFGMVSDMHLDGITNLNAEGLSKNAVYLDEALTFFEEQGCSFCCHAGDITNIGFWSDSSDKIYLTQMADFKKVVDKHKDVLPIYGCCGNHESYNKSIIENLAELKEYTNIESLCYTITQGTDVFIFFSQPGGTKYVQQNEWKNQLNNLRQYLEENRNKRCFVFEHLTLSDDSGNPNNIHNAYWYELEDTLTGMLKHYKNTMLFHGHSHLDLNEQFNFSYSNYSTKKGFKSISIPSSGGSRITSEGALVKTNREDLRSGYIADVYENCVVLKGYYFATKKCIPIAQYCIDTTIKPIEADTFTDNTGIIAT